MTDIVKQYLDKLQGLLDSGALDVEGRIFILNEMWDIEIDTRK